MCSTILYDHSCMDGGNGWKISMDELRRRDCVVHANNVRDNQTKESLNHAFTALEIELNCLEKNKFTTTEGKRKTKTARKSNKKRDREWFAFVAFECLGMSSAKDNMSNI